MNIITLLQTSTKILGKSEEIQANDPYGIIITLISITMVFCALTALYLAYSVIGKLFSPQKGADNNMPAYKVPDEVAAAISMALDQHFKENVHDDESYIITIKRK